MADESKADDREIPDLFALARQQNGDRLHDHFLDLRQNVCNMLAILDRIDASLDRCLQHTQDAIDAVEALIQFRNRSRL